MGVKSASDVRVVRVVSEVEVLLGEEEVVVRGVGVSVGVLVGVGVFVGVSVFVGFDSFVDVFVR